MVKRIHLLIINGLIKNTLYKKVDKKYKKSSVNYCIIEKKVVTLRRFLKFLFYEAHSIYYFAAVYCKE